MHSAVGCGWEAVLGQALEHSPCEHQRYQVSGEEEMQSYHEHSVLPSVRDGMLLTGDW